MQVFYCTQLFVIDHLIGTNQWQKPGSLQTPNSKLEAQPTQTPKECADVLIPTKVRGLRFEKF